MRYAMSLPCGGDRLAVQTLVDLAVELETVGWDGVFLEDYLVHYRGDDPATYDPWLVLAAVAGRTSTITLGIGVTGLLARDPVKLAREALTLRDLSGGRVVLGVGLGDPGDRGASIHPLWDPERPRGEQMDERLDLLLDLLAQPDPRSSRVRVQPLEDAGGRVPVWVGGSSQVGVVARRAARAQGVLPYKLSDTEQWSDFTSDEVAELAGAVASQRGAPGVLSGFDIAIGGRRRLASVAAERAAVDAAARGGATWWVEYIYPGSPDKMFEAVRRGPVRASSAVG